MKILKHSKITADCLKNFFSKFHWYSLYQFLSAGPLQRTEPNMHRVDPFLEVARDDGLEFQICSLKS